MGNTRFLLNAAGQELSEGAYTAWGGCNDASYPSTPFGWKGQWGAYRDAETNLVQMGARYFSPALGRFISRDPSGFSAGPNLYGFCAGDPIDFFDPTGCGNELEDGPFWGTVRGWAENDQRRLAELQRKTHGAPLIGFSPGISVTLIGLHDSFRDWGEAEGNTKSSPGKLMWMRLGAATHFGLAAFEFSGYGLAATRGPTGMMSTGCFVAGTPVQTVVKGADGKYHTLVKPIEKMRQGDLVFARDPKTGKTQLRRVLKTTVRQVERVLTVALADAKTHKVVERITASREHPFYVRGKGFVPAGRLAVGNAIVTRAGSALVVQSVKWNRRREGYTVYNFVVEDDHSYFVGTHNGGAWVHNPGFVCSRISDIPFARRLAEDMPREVNDTVNGMVNSLNKTGELPSGIGYRGLGDGFIELRSSGNARAIVKKVGDTWELIGKFEAHTRGDNANSAIIQRLLRLYRDL